MIAFDVSSFIKLLKMGHGIKFSVPFFIAMIFLKTVKINKNKDILFIKEN
jgi:hypothetical protein